MMAPPSGVSLSVQSTLTNQSPSDPPNIHLNSPKRKGCIEGGKKLVIFSSFFLVWINFPFYDMKQLPQR